MRGRLGVSGGGSDMNKQSGLPALGLMLAVGLVVSTWIASDTVRDIRTSHQIIKVRGYAEVPVRSDLAVWEVTVLARGEHLAQAHELLEGYRRETVDFLTSAGIPVEEIASSTVLVEERHERNDKGMATNVVEGYDVSQTLGVRTRSVDLVADVASRTAELLGRGVQFRAYAPRFTFTGVDELKSRLLVEATKDARERAATLAESSGMELGPLRAARQGAFSVRAADASSVSERDDDDHASIDKKVSAVVTVDYAMR